MSSTGSVDSGIRLVLLDAVGTLLRPLPSVPQVYHAAARRHGSRRSAEQIAADFRRAWAEQFPTRGDLRTDPQRERARWRQIVRQVIPDARDGEALFEELWDHFARPESWQLYDDVGPALEILQRSGCLWGVASNFDSRLRPIAARRLPTLAAERIFLSVELGWRKPAVEFFRAVEQRCGLSRGEILLVGDDWQEDFLAGQAAGWRTVWLCRDSAAPSHSAPPESAGQAPPDTLVEALTRQFR